MLSLDCETTGLDLRHSARPFFVSTCDEEGNVGYWQWDVNPLTRVPLIPAEDVAELTDLLIGCGDCLVFQNAKFDVAALASVGIPSPPHKFPWPKVYDTLMAGHLLASNQPHGLDDMASHYLWLDLVPYEDRLREAVMACRREVQQARLRVRRGRTKKPRGGRGAKALKEFREVTAEDEPLAEWVIAEAGLPGMPSATGKTWKHDCWLPRAMVRYWWETSEAYAAYMDGMPVAVYRVLSPDRLAEVAVLPGWEYRPPGTSDYEDPGHVYWTILRDYSNADSAATVGLWPVMRGLLEERGLWKIFLTRMRVPAIGYGMEHRGVTANGEQLQFLTREYTSQRDELAARCLSIAASCDVPCECALPPAPPPAPGAKGGKRAAKAGKGAVGAPAAGGVTDQGPGVPAGARGHGQRRAGAAPQAAPAAGVGPGPALAAGGLGGPCGACNGQGVRPYTLTLPKGASPNNSLRTLLFDVMGLPGMRGHTATTNAPSLNKEALSYYELTLPPRSKPALFIRALRDKRKLDTALAYMAAYQRFWIPLVGPDGRVVPGWYVLHPGLNPTGTVTLRWSSENPNEQNISKKDIEDEGGNKASLRSCFGPAPGREWWSFDGKNLELRIPAYAAGEEAMIALFERPDDPPYYGSNHLLNFHTVYPDVWDGELGTVCADPGCCGDRVVTPETVGPHCKKRFASSWYQYVKNGGFAVQYGAIDRAGGEGTADRAFHRAGAHGLLKRRFAKIHGPGGLNERCIRHAEKYGYVETIPDTTVDPTRGYPLMCTRTEHGQILPTVPLNYVVQGTACWWMMMAMIRVQDQLDEWNAADARLPRPRGGYHMALQVHDELVLDFPAGKGPEPWKTNLPKARRVQALMAMGGEGIGVPTPVSCEWHQTSWASGKTF
jgi:DNA polymerase I-like protein with 3'-5' exonuclease and polymerase domains